jgi:polysaccharide export outer membrane protein
MRKITARLLASTIMVLASLPVLAGPDENPGNYYTILPGDILDVSVWQEEELVRKVLVLPDGSISFPLVGTIETAGKSVEELQKIIAEKLEKYIPEPNVTVAVEQLSGNKIYVIGNVTRSGEFIATRNMDVIQALSVAGGMTPYASANKIQILRRTGGKLSSTRFKYGDIEQGENLQQNIMLQGGDVILVP